MSDVGVRKKRLETDAWERHRQIIEHLYLDQGQGLEQVMTYMKANFEFEATEQAYKKKLRRWKISKNIPANVMEYILTEIDNRHLQGKESTIFWHDRPVDGEKIERSRQRMNRDKKDNPEKPIIRLAPCMRSGLDLPGQVLTTAAVLRLIRIDTPPLQPEIIEPRQAHLPLRLDIPHAPAPMSLYTNPVNLSLNPNVSTIPSFTFTQFDPMMMDRSPISATSSVSYFEGDGQIVTTQLPLSPIIPASDFDLDQMLGIDADFDQLKNKLSMGPSMPEVQRAMQRGNKLLQAGSALFPKDNVESMDVSRVDNQEALAYYRSVLTKHGAGANGPAIADALRHISQIQANSSLPDPQPDVSMADRERLLAGFLFFFGSDSPVYLRQVFDFCDKGISSTDPTTWLNQATMFKNAIQKMLDRNLPMEKTMTILRTVDNYFNRGLITPDEMQYYFSRIVTHHPPSDWWKDCENILFVAKAFLGYGMYNHAEPYLLSAMKEAYTHMLAGDFFTQDQNAYFMFTTLSNHVCSGDPEYQTALMDLETGLRTQKSPSQFDCLELTCWILLAMAYVNFTREPTSIIFMLGEARLENRLERPLQISWHFIDGVTGAMVGLAKRLQLYRHEEYAQYIENLAIDVNMRWAMPKLYPE